jgi:hypothetical protein
MYMVATVIEIPTTTNIRREVEEKRDHERYITQE